MVNHRVVVLITLGSSEIQVDANKLDTSIFKLEYKGKAKPFFSFLFSNRKNDKKTAGNNSETILVHKATGKSLSLKINRGYQGVYLLKSPRKDGKLLADNYNLFEAAIQMPLLEPFVNSTLKECIIYKVIIVYTDQAGEPGIKENFLENDTVYFEELVQKKYFSELSDQQYFKFPIIKNLTDIDLNYSDFASRLKEITGDDNQIDKLILLAQGGIDQINHALTLQLLHQYREKVFLYQVPEKSGIRELRFPQLFLRDLTLKQAELLIDKYNYTGASELIHRIEKNQHNEQLVQSLLELLKHAHLRFNGLYNDAKNFGRKSFPQGCPDVINNFKNNQFSPGFEYTGMFNHHKQAAEFAAISANAFFVADAFYSINNYTGFSLNLAIFIERFLVHYIDSKSVIDTQIRNTNLWDNEVCRLVRALRDLYPDFPEKTLENQIFTQFEKKFKPGGNIPSLFVIAYTISQNDSERKFLDTIIKLNSFCSDKYRVEAVDQSRNKIAHRGEGVKELRSALIDHYEKNLRVYFGNPYVNPFDELNAALKEYIGRLLKL